MARYLTTEELHDCPNCFIRCALRETDKECRDASVIFHARTLFRCPNCTTVLGVKFDVPRDGCGLVQWGAA